MRAEKPESLIWYGERTRDRSVENRPPRNEREKVENQRGCGGDAKASVGTAESLRAAETHAAAGDGAGERIPVTLNILRGIKWTSNVEERESLPLKLRISVGPT